jgi:hypothetical protein
MRNPRCRSCGLRLTRTTRTASSTNDHPSESLAWRLADIKAVGEGKRIACQADLKSCLFIHCSYFIADSIPVFGPMAVQLISFILHNFPMDSESEENWQKFHPRLILILKLKLCSVQTSTSGLGLGTGCGPEKATPCKLRCLLCII